MEHVSGSTNAAVEEIIGNTEVQAEKVRNISEMTDSIASAIEQIYQNMANLKQSAETALQCNDHASGIMKELIQISKESSRAMDEVSEQTRKTNESAQEIRQVTEIIAGISSQTNLLALNASIEAARAGESGKGFAVVADQVRQLSINTAESAEDIVKYVSELKTNIDELATAMEETTQSLGEGSKKVEKSLAALEQMNGQMDSIRGRVDSIFDDIDTQTGVTKSFAMQMGNISESYSVLSKDCLQSGHRIFEVGRYLDKTRSDLVRGCSEITQQDWMRVFEVDHYVLTWRVYNNIVGFEHLQKKQVDNPAGCKLGKWLNRQTDERLVRSSEYTALVKAHNDLHHFATLSWQAKEDGNTEKALAYFNNTYGAFMEYDKALKHLQQRMKELGYNTDTQIAAFGGR